MLPSGSDIPPHVLQAAARKYALRVARRYAPLVIGGLAVLLVALLLPSLSNNPSAFVASGGAVETGGGTGGGGGVGEPGAAGQGSVSATGSGVTAPALGGSAGAGGAGSAVSASGAAPATGSSPSGSAVGAGGSTATLASNLTKTGIRCAAGVRQFTWSAYAPYCVSAWHGNNGGATAQGVTGSTITITYRETNSSQDTAVEAYASGANAGSDAQYVQDLQTYVKFFNSQFELYGRKVVLKPYQGQGDPLLEDQGQDLEGAQADAATAQSLGAFTDVSSILGEATQPYDDDLAQNHISSWGNVYVGQAEINQYAPYIFSTLFPSGDVANNAFLDIMCRRMVGLPAIFSADPTYQVATRKFGLILPDRPGSSTSETELGKGMQACGSKFADTSLYTINVGQMASQAASIMAQYKAQGITTIMCGCDPVFDVFLAQAADDQIYKPEWLTVWWGDSFAQLTSQDQWSQDLANGGVTPDLAKTEAYSAFKLASPGQQPAEAYYSVPYLMLLQIFSAIQAAGPRLTPASFANAYFHLPGGNGTFGPLGFAPGKYNPMVAFQVGWWNSKATSSYNGKTGAYQNCNGGQWVAYNDLAALGPDHTQLHCFGK